MAISPPNDAFLASLVDSSGDAILSKDPKGVITSWNRGAELIFGYTAAEAIGRPITLIIPPDRLEEDADILSKIARGERIDHHETVRRRKDGSHVELSISVSPILNDAGAVIGGSTVARDITAQRREQERLSVTLASIGDAVISTDEQGRVAFMNPVAEKLTGWPGSEARGMPLVSVFRIVNETTRLAVKSPVEQVLAEGVIVGLANHTILIARDGAEFPIDDSAAPIRDRVGQLIGVVLVFRDVSARRAAELDALRLAAIVEGSEDAIISKNLQGVIQSWNPGAERIFGYGEKEVLGKPITILLPPDRLTEEQRILARLQRGERVDHFQTERVRKNGERIHVSLTISPIRNDEGRVIGASKIARDITALRLAQEKIERHASELELKVRDRTAKLEATVAELEAFSYSLSHDMRAPLRAIHSFAEIVLNDHTDAESEGAAYLRQIIGAAGRMDRLIRDVLSFARLGTAEIELVPVDVEKLVRDILQERPELGASRNAVAIESPLLRVMGHEASLTQCLSNLLSNAVKFVAQGVTPKVVVFTERRGDRVRIGVRDNGIGISPAGQRRLFAIFQRLHPADRYEGTGVGLAIVRKAVERMNGVAGVDSAEGRGSTFWLELSASES